MAGTVSRTAFDLDILKEGVDGEKLGKANMGDHSRLLKVMYWLYSLRICVILVVLRAVMTKPLSMDWQKVDKGNYRLRRVNARRNVINKVNENLAQLSTKSGINI